MSAAGIPAQRVAEAPPGLRRLQMIRASDIPIEQVQWVWDERIALGTVHLLAGRESKGKSTLAYWLAAQITRGLLPGKFYGHPKSVIVAATEDSWSTTINPRIVAAGGDLDRVFRVDVVTEDRVTELVLPADVGRLTVGAMEKDAGLILLDPLLTRLSSKVDTHKEREVREAIEPLKPMAEAAGLAVVGIVHVNKSTNSDSLNSIMGSGGFKNVARGVSMAFDDPGDPEDRWRCLVLAKSNLSDDAAVPIRRYRIVGATVHGTNGPVETSTLEWGDDFNGTKRDLAERNAEPSESRSQVGQAIEWIEEFLNNHGGRVDRVDIVREGKVEGFSPDSLKRAVRQAGTLDWENIAGATPRRTVWRLTDKYKPAEKAVAAVAS